VALREGLAATAADFKARLSAGTPAKHSSKADKKD
jgi:hypothetical protein